jgi:hypothetical protein
MADAEAMAASTEPDPQGLLRRLAALWQTSVGAGPAARPVCVVESPASMLARTAAEPSRDDGLPFDEARLLEQWCQSARGLLRQVQRSPGKTALLHADELLGWPREAWAQKVTSILGDPPASTLSGPEFEQALQASESMAAPPVALAVALASVSRHADATRLWSELLGSCLPLAQGKPAPPDGPVPGVLDDWRRQRAEEAELRDELRQCQNQTVVNEATLAERSRLIDLIQCDLDLSRLLQRQALDDLAEMADRVARAEAEAAELRASLTVERDARLAETRRLAGLQQRVDELQAQVARSEAELNQRTGSLQLALDTTNDSLEQERSRFDHATKGRIAELDALRLERAHLAVLVDRLRQEADLRVQQIGQVQGELGAQVEVLTAALATAEQRRESLATEHQHSLSEAARQLDELTRQLRTAEGVVPKLNARVAVLAADLDTARQHALARQQETEALLEAHQALQLAAAEAGARADAVDASLADLRQEGARIAARSQQLEREVLQAREAADATAQARAAAELQGQQLALEAQRVRQQRARLEQELLQARQDRELLEVQLGSALAGLADSIGGGRAAGDNALARLCGAFERARVGVRDEQWRPPHRELALSVRLPAAFAHETPSSGFELRLVEHEGRPGLIWLAQPGSPPPLHAWSSTGHEEDREYMRLIPADSDDAATLAQLPSADWRLVVAAARSLPEVLPQCRLDASAAWVPLAGRLVRQLEAMPPRLRYSELRTQWLHPGATAELLLADAMFGAQTLSDIRLRLDLRPQAEAPLRWLLPEDGEPDLGCWPVGQDGMPLPECTIAIKPGHAQARRWWAELPVRDRDIVLGVLDALPAVAEPLQGPVSAAALRERIVLWHREARRLLARQGLRRRLKSLRQIMGLARPVAANTRE